MPLKLELKDILELTHDLNGSTLSSLNESLSSYLSLGGEARIVQIGNTKLQVEGSIRDVPRAVPLYLYKDKVHISLWETIKSITANKGVIFGYIPIELVNSLKGSLVELKFLKYSEVYDQYESEMIKFLSLPKDKQFTSRLPNIHLIKSES